MATGRTTPFWRRFYADGYDYSNDFKTIGPLTWEFDVAEDAAVNRAVKGGWNGQVTISPGTGNFVFDSTTLTGIHTRMKVSGANHNLMIPQGIQAAPAQGDPVYVGQFPQSSFSAEGESLVAATIKFGNSSKDSAAYQYQIPWGKLLHANGAETAVNTAAGIGGLGETLVGGYMAYQVFSAVGNGDIRATIKVQDCDTSGGTYNDLLSSGIINCGSAGVAVPTSGVVALARSAHVQSYTRWQVVFSVVGGHECTSLTFALAFIRNFI